MPRSCSSSTSSEACQKNRYGEIVVPRMATTVAIMPRSSCSRGTKVDGERGRPVGVRHERAEDVGEDDERHDLEIARELRVGHDDLGERDRDPDRDDQGEGRDPVSSSTTAAMASRSAPMLTTLATNKSSTIGSSQRRP